MAREMDAGSGMNFGAQGGAKSTKERFSLMQAEEKSGKANLSPVPFAPFCG